MGYNQSKEEKEIIISQAGNSGGTTATTGTVFTLWEVGMAFLVFVVICTLGYMVWKKCRRNMERKIRREVARSHELLSLNIGSARCDDK